MWRKVALSDYVPNETAREHCLEPAATLQFYPFVALPENESKPIIDHIKNNISGLFAQNYVQMDMGVRVFRSVKLGVGYKLAVFQNGSALRFNVKVSSYLW